MLVEVPITSLDAPELRPYRTLKQTVEHFHLGLFVAEGEKVADRLFESSFTVLSALMTPEHLDRRRVLLEQRPENIAVYTGTRGLLSTIVGYDLHQCIMAVGRIPRKTGLVELMRALPRPYFLVATDGIVSSENLGVIVRNCAGLGAQALIAGENCSSPFLRRSVRNSMGAIFRLPVFESPAIMETLSTLRRDFGVHVIAAHPHAGGTSIYTIDCTKSICIVFGNEGDGLPERILSLSDSTAEIPMHAETDSLNVACAGAVFLAEVQRQRRGGS